MEVDALLKKHVDADGYTAPANLNQADIEKLYIRDNIVNRRIRKNLEDLFGESPEIHAENDELKEKIERFLFSSNGLYNKLREASKHAFLDGHCLIYFNYDNDQDLSREHQGDIKSIPKIGIIFARDVGNPIIEKDIKDENYNEVIGWDFMGEQIHHSRLINVVYDSIYNEPKGISILSPEFDYHMMRKSIMQDAVQSYHQNASGIKIFELPENPSVEDVEWMKENVKKIRGRGELTAPHGTKVQHPAPKVTDPTPYIAPTMEMGCSMPYQILVGTSAGAITGSETNLKNYEKEIHNLRKTVLNQWINEKIEYLQEKNYFGQGEFTLDWGDYKEITQEQESLIEFRKVKSAKDLFEMGILDDEEVRDWIGITSKGEVESEKEDTRFDRVNKPSIDQENRDRLWQNLSPEDVDKIIVQLNIPDSIKHENKYVGMMKEWESDQQDRWMDGLNKILNTETESILKKLKNKLFAREIGVEEELITAVVKITGIGERELKGILDQLYLTSYLQGFNFVAELHNSPILREITGYAQTWLENNSVLRSQITTDNLNNRIKHKVIGAIRDKKTTGELERIIASEIKDYSHNVETLARTELNYSMNQGRLDSYEQMGVRQVSIMAVGDDRTCDFCMALDGFIYDLNEARDLLPVHPNCRCVIISTDEFRGVNL